MYFPPTEDRRWSFSGEFGRFVGWNGAVFHDIDGSVGGVPDSYIVIDNGIADDAKACEIKPSWNAAVCKGDFGRLNIGGGGFGGGGFGGRGAGAARGGAAGPGAAAGRGGPGAAAGRGGPAGRWRHVVVEAEVLGGAAQPPVILSRNGRELTANGDTTVRSGTEIKAETERTPLSISVRELDRGSWVILELPGFTTASSGTPQTSLDALRSASDTSYYKGDGSLWVKLVSNGGGAVAGGAAGRGGVPPSSIQVSR